MKGSHGTNGMGKSKDGKKGRDVTVYVPPGTIIREGGKEAREKEGGGRVAGEVRACRGANGREERREAR